MSPFVLTALTFLAAVLAVAGVYSILVDLVLRDRALVSQRLDEEFHKKQRLRAERSPLFKNLAQLLPGDNVLESGRMSIRRWFESTIEQSGLDIRASALLTIMLIGALALGSGFGIYFQSWIPGVVVGLVAFVIPFLVVQYKRRKRLDKMLAQLPDALELISRLIKAGKTISQAFQGVGDEFQPPLASEFAYCYEQQNLGLAPEIAMRDLARRVGLVEVKIFILAVIIQRQTGGNLAELIENLSSLVRERFRIQGKIRILTAEGRMEAVVLLAMPPIVFAMILWLNHDYGMLLFTHPNVLWAMGGMMLVGWLWIKKIISFQI